MRAMLRGVFLLETNKTLVGQSHEAKMKDKKPYKLFFIQ